MGFAMCVITIVIIFVFCTVDFEAIYSMLQKNLYFVSSNPTDTLQQ
ncbi:hypothetical protein [Bacillus cereus]|nr:hypothetical protein [Bacillus cereus]